VLGVILSTTGCGTFVAHRLAQAPNRYPDWFDFEAPVQLGFSPRFLTNFPAEYVTVAPPPARLRYRVVPPAEYHWQEHSTNWSAHGRREFLFRFQADFPAATNAWSTAPKGTVILLHGYGLAQFSLAPWAIRLAQEGWQCVLVDLRGHGKSTGRQIYFGVRETGDLTQLLDALAARGELRPPVAVLGESYGAALALRWKAADPRVGPVVSIAPYASLSNAVMNIRNEYVSWLPRPMVRAGLCKLPGVLGVSAADLDTVPVMELHPVTALFVAGAQDKIAPVAEVEKLRALASPDSRMLVVPEATHEALSYFFDDLTPAVLAWLEQGRKH